MFEKYDNVTQDANCKTVDDVQHNTAEILATHPAVPKKVEDKQARTLKSKASDSNVVTP